MEKIQIKTEFEYLFIQLNKMTKEIVIKFKICTFCVI